MPSAPEQARVYCAWAKRQAADEPGVDGDGRRVRPRAFGVVPLRDRTRCRGAVAGGDPTQSAEKMTHVNTQAGFASLASLKGALFAALVLDDTGEATCTKLRLEPTKVPGQHELVLFAHAGVAESRHPFELRGGTLHFTQEGRI